MATKTEPRAPEEIACRRWARQCYDEMVNTGWTGEDAEKVLNDPELQALVMTAAGLRRMHEKHWATIWGMVEQMWRGDKEVRT